jgi:hypothetical protein
MRVRGGAVEQRQPDTLELDTRFASEA